MTPLDKLLTGKTSTDPDRLLFEFCFHYGLDPDIFFELQPGFESSKDDVVETCTVRAMSLTQWSEDAKIEVALSYDQAENIINTTRGEVLTTLCAKIEELKTQMSHMVSYGDPDVYVETVTVKDIVDLYPEMSEEQARYVIYRMEKGDYSLASFVEGTIDFYTPQLDNIARYGQPYPPVDKHIKTCKQAADMINKHGANDGAARLDSPDR